MIYNHISSKKARKIKYNPDKHIPNKVESRLLRRLMSEKSLSEGEVRGDVKYRRMLAEVVKLNKKTINENISNWYYKLIRNACRKSKLAPQHPETLDILQSILSDYIKGTRHIPWYVYNIKTTAKEVVKFYAKS